MLSLGTTGFRCRSCSKLFGRAEHLRRHELSHNNIRPFRCTECPKSFGRRDALQRHELTHDAPPNLLQRGGRACSQCALAKVRCSGGQTCDRCQARGIECIMTRSTADDTPEPDNLHPSASSLQGVEPNSVLPYPHIGDDQYWDRNILSGVNWLDSAFDTDDASTLLPQMTYVPEDVSAGQHAGSISDVGTVAAAEQPNTHAQPNMDANESPRSTLSLQSFVFTDTSTSSNTCEGSRSRAGEYYVDGRPARLPRVKRRKTSLSRRTAEPQSLPFFSLQTTMTVAHSDQDVATIQPETYREIQESYQGMCLHPPAPWPPFDSSPLPDAMVFDQMVSLYFKHFDQTMPCLHHTQRATIGHHGPVIVAIAAIGSHFLGEEASITLTTSMHEFLRRWLLYLQEDPLIRQDSIWHSTAVLLNTVGMLYCGNEWLKQQALKRRLQLRALFEVCRQKIKPASVTHQENGTCPVTWVTWCERECNVRLAHSTWLIDSMLVYHFDQSPMLGLHEASLFLPCSEKLWNAASVEDWQIQLNNHHPDQTISSALKELYIEKRLSQDTGEFARVLIIHGLFHRQFEVEHHFQNPLSYWEPTATRQSAADVLPRDPIWLPSIPSFTRWQNSACDCLDILHWQANAAIGHARGIEHPTVMHLHLARIVLLTPFKDIVDLARSMTGRMLLVPSDSLAAKQRLIRLWAVQHQYKARLAAIHAGVVFWHVRRYSIDAFYEGPAVALAALVLWAFGTFASKEHSSGPASVFATQTGLQQQANEEEETSEESDDTTCSIILLDRPTDDELVQNFIRDGQSMTAHVTGVGDLCAARGPERVLAQGIKLLSLLKCWRVGASWAQLLQALENVVRSEPRDE